MRCIERWYFQWSWRTLTQFSRSQHFWSRISQKRCVLGTKLLKNTNRKLYAIYRMVPLSMTLSNLWHGFQGHDIFEVKYRKVTKLLLHKRKLYMEWCYVWWPWLTSKRVARVCQHQLSFLFLKSLVSEHRLQVVYWQSKHPSAWALWRWSPRHG